MNTNSSLAVTASALAMIVASDPASGNIGNGFRIIGPFKDTDSLRAHAKSLLADTAQARWTEVSFSYVAPTADDRQTLGALTEGGEVRCIIVLKDENGDLTKGFDVVGPFTSDESLAGYVDNEIDTSTHWTEADMTYVPGQIEVPEPDQQESQAEPAAA